MIIGISLPSLATKWAYTTQVACEVVASGSIWHLGPAVAKWPLYMP